MERVTWFFLVYLICCEAFSCLTTAAQTDHNITTDQSALLALQARITSDPQKMILTNWSTSTTSVCNWVGVTCGARHHRVTALNLSYFGLAGTIPPELGNLSFLVDLDFLNNSFHGTLPQELAHLRRLKYISLGYNKFKGVIPSWFGSLSKLQEFWLYGNQFSGFIPATIFNLSALRIIDLSHNQLSEIPKEIGNLSRLQKLFVEENALKGHIPMTIFNISSLVTLSFFGNKLNGTIPDNICQHLPNIQVLNLGANQFEGPVPFKSWQCKQLLHLTLGINNLNGSIPNNISQNLPNLEELYLDGNKFSGRIPKDIANLTHIKIINLDRNSFTEIPKEIGNLSRLQKLFVEENALKGHIPMTTFNISSLVTLSFFGNKLNGTIPDNICQHLPNIQVLNLGANQFEGPVPFKSWQCKQLLQLTLGINNLNGSIPDTISQNLPNIEELYLDGNKFSGRIPKDIANLTHIKIINLARNSFTGTIPHEIGYLPNLEKLLLDDNNLEGHIPSSIFNMSTITELYLGNNKLSGSLPENIDMPAIAKLFLGNNQLSGSLPENIGLGLPNLQEFEILMNRLRGVIPKSISNASELSNLNVQTNLLSGFIPTSLGLLKNLQILEMGSNSFSGFIPSSLCFLKNLEWLRFYDNNLTIDTSTREVNIWSCLANLTNLRIVNFGRNPLNTELSISFSNFSASIKGVYLGTCSLRGNIPSDIGNLSSLIDLDLQENHLSGTIPSSMGGLLNLQGLFMHDNTLKGNIPNEICQLHNLVEFNLGWNQLSGSIPSCLGKLTSLRYLYLGSNLLNSTIPSSFWELTDILEINLSSNFLTGPISDGVGSLKVVTSIDVSYNQLSGSIPSSIGSLLSMVNLSLAHNNLEGPIPSSFATCLSLVRLDLSQNGLSGVIPKSLEALSYLKYLNLSFNRLQGEIPAGGPFKNFSAESFVSNHGLCGASQFHVSACKTRSSIHVLKYVIPGILLVMLLVTSIWMLMARRKMNVTAASHTMLTPQVLWRRVSYQELLGATDGFNESNLLGTGGFGSVYRGTLLDGTDVAVKVFNLELEEAFTSFEVECEVLSNVRHRNLVKVLSCCSQIDFKALVLDYMPNGSLEKWLYSQNSSLNIMQRLDIMIDVASALEYLHHGYEVPIVHCDLKPSNILLDADMVAHVADFGIAKLLGGGDSMTQTMTLATIGYMAPEYGTEGIVTRRGDVYSFGIVLMETFTRRKPTNEIFIGELRMSRWVANFLVSDAIVKVVDATLLGTEEDHDFVSKRECLSSIMRLAVACSAEFPDERINIQEALATLKSIKIKFLKDSAT